MDRAISAAFSWENSFSIITRPKSTAVPAPRDVRRNPSATTRASVRMSGNSAATGRLEEMAQESGRDEHRAALLYAAARWIDESGRDLSLVVREGNFRTVFPFGSLAQEAEAVFRESGRA